MELTDHFVDRVGKDLLDCQPATLACFLGLDFLLTLGIPRSLLRRSFLDLVIEPYADNSYQLRKLVCRLGLAVSLLKVAENHA